MTARGASRVSGGLHRLDGAAQVPRRRVRVDLNRQLRIASMAHQPLHRQPADAVAGESRPKVCRRLWMSSLRPSSSSRGIFARSRTRLRMRIALFVRRIHTRTLPGLRNTRSAGDRSRPSLLVHLARRDSRPPPPAAAAGSPLLRLRGLGAQHDRARCVASKSAQHPRQFAPAGTRLRNANHIGAWGMRLCCGRWLLSPHQSCRKLDVAAVILFGGCQGTARSRRRSAPAPVAGGRRRRGASAGCAAGWSRSARSPQHN